MSKPASEKQIKFANTIAYTLHLELPKEKTAQAYYLFIKKNIIAYQDHINSDPNYDDYDYYEPEF